ncbi:hypothetical protein DBO95_05980, partial [Yersinia pestis]
GRGLFSVPGMEGNRDGEDWSPIFTSQSHTLENNLLTIISEDTSAGLRLVSELQMCPDSGVIKTRNTLTNIKAGCYRIDRLAVTLPFRNVPMKSWPSMAVGLKSSSATHLNSIMAVIFRKIGAAEPHMNIFPAW